MKQIRRAVICDVCIQERKPHPMVEVCQLTDVLRECDVGRGGRWRAIFWKGRDDRCNDSWRSRMLMRGRWSRRSCLATGGTCLAVPGGPDSHRLGAKVIQQRKPHPMLAVCQLTDVREVCEAGRGGRWRALHWKGGEELSVGSGRCRMLMRSRHDLRDHLS